MDSEEKYLDISRKLKNLEQVKASDNFVHNLHSKIVELEAEKRHEHEKRFDEGRGGFLRNLFGNMQYPWLVPAAGFTVLIFFVFYMTFLNKNASEKSQPLLTDQKQESIEQKNFPPEQNKPPVTAQENTLDEKEKLPGKDIAGDLKTEKKIQPQSVENENELVDRNDFKNNKPEIKPAEAENKDEELKTGMNETKGFAKREAETNKTESDGLLATEPEDEASTSINSATDSDSVKQSKSKESDDAFRIKLDEKLRRINRSNLERIREEIVK